MGSVTASAQAFVAQVFRIGSWRAELPPPTSFSLEGARAMSELVLEHPAVRGDGLPDMQLRLFGQTDDGGLEVLRDHAVGYLISGAVALSLTGEDYLATGLIHAAADPASESLLLRANLLRQRLFEPPPHVIPEWLEPIERFVRRNCFAGVLKAVLDIGKWAGSRSTSYSIGITKVTPSTCLPSRRADAAWQRVRVHQAGRRRRLRPDARRRLPRSEDRVVVRPGRSRPCAR